MRIIGLIALSLCVGAGTAGAADLKIASWNIGNLAQGPGIALRDHERSQEEYDHIQKIAASLDADIFALQEMGSLPAARAALGSGYEIVFEQRCLDNKAKCESDVGDIFTAIAYKATIGKVEVLQVPELAIMHTSECSGEPPRPVRGGVGLRVDQNGKKLSVLSVHLKSACKKNENENAAGQMDDCATLKAQIAILIDWMKGRKAVGDEVIVVGDFNRELLNAGDNVAASFKSFDAGIKFTPTERQCWAAFNPNKQALIDAAAAKYPEISQAGGDPVPYLPRSNAKIDYFVVSGTIAASLPAAAQYPMGAEASITDPASSYMKTCDGKPSKFENGGVLTYSEVEPSDHCPITLTLD